VVAHSYNPRYLGGRDQEDCYLNLAQGKYSSQDPISKKYPTQKTAAGVGKMYSRNDFY
jgi:hypothetical protein